MSKPADKYVEHAKQFSSFDDDLSWTQINNMDEYELPTIKKPTIDLNRFKVTKETEPEFAHWVNETAKLINRTYFQTFKLVEKWSLELIIRRYELCTKHAGGMSGDVKWWWLRKESLKVNK